MKKLFLFFLMLGFLFTTAGCGILSLDRIDGVRTTAILAEITAREIGYTIAETEDPEIDRAIRNVYTLGKTGELSQDAMDQITDLIAKKMPTRPTLPQNIMSLLQLVGVRFNADGQAFGLDKIPPEIYVAVERGYLSGIDLYKRQKIASLTKGEVKVILDENRDYYNRLERGRHGRHGRRL